MSGYFPPEDGMNLVISATATPMPNTEPSILKYKDHSIDVLREMPYPTTSKMKETVAREPGMFVLSITAEGYIKTRFLQDAPFFAPEAAAPVSNPGIPYTMVATP